MATFRASVSVAFSPILALMGVGIVAGCQDPLADDPIYVIEERPPIEDDQRVEAPERPDLLPVGDIVDDGLTLQQILHVAHTANAGDLAHAAAAIPRLTSEPVQELADWMVREHARDNQDLEWFVESSQLELSDNEVSIALAGEYEAGLDELAAADPENVDSVYLDLQRTMHDRVLALLDETLLPRLETLEARDADYETLEASLALLRNMHSHAILHLSERDAAETRMNEEAEAAE